MLFAVILMFPVLGYLSLVKWRRFQRAEQLARKFGTSSRPLSTMTLKEAYAIIDELQTLEFPTAFNKARAYALLKTGGIPTISKILMATGQSSEKMAPKRAVDTNVLLVELQTNDVDSDRHYQAIARMNYLHERYRKVGKILDTDMLHTLGSGMVEIIRFVNDYEWRRLTPVELCALGVWHKALGEAMKIPYDELPSSAVGWTDGTQFAEELAQWVERYEARVAVNAPSNSAFVNRYIETKTGNMPSAIKPLLRRVVAADLDDIMRESMGLEKPGALLRSVLDLTNALRRFGLRYLCLPKPDSSAYRLLQKNADPQTGLYNFRHRYIEPWYIKSSNPRQSDPEKYRAQGYNISNIGPAHQEGKGMDEMEATIQFLKSSARSGCPFSHTVKQEKAHA